MIEGKSKYAETSPILTAKSSTLRSVRYEILDENQLDFETRGKQYMNCQGQDSKYIKMCGQIDYYKKEGKNLEKALELSYKATDQLLLETDWGIDDEYTQGYLNGKPILKNGKILGCGAAAQEIKYISLAITSYEKVNKK